MSRPLAMWIGLGVVLAAAVASAQVGSGQITGVLTDTQGAVLPEVTVTATNVDTGATRQVATTTAGVYTLTGLGPGVYGIHAARAGFKAIERHPIRVQTGETLRLDFTLVIENVNETIVIDDT